MSRLALIFLLAGSLLIAGAQQAAEPPLPPPAVLTACLPNLSSLQPLGRFDLGTPRTPTGGQATVAVTVDFNGTAKLKLVSASYSALGDLALSNLKTWKFAKYQPGRIVVTFLVRVLGKPTYGFGNAKVVFDFPSRVTITVAPFMPEVVRARPRQRP